MSVSTPSRRTWPLNRVASGQWLKRILRVRDPPPSLCSLIFIFNMKIDQRSGGWVLGSLLRSDSKDSFLKKTYNQPKIRKKKKKVK